jgi:hypothetical protein
LTFTLGTSAAISAVPLLLVDVHMEEGIVGHSYLFCYTAHVAEAVEPSRGGALLQDAFTLLRAAWKGRSAADPTRSWIYPKSNWDDTVEL